MLATRELYDQSATRWERTEPVLLSDFTARPAVLRACGLLGGREVLDLGCGEGYVARQLAARGAARVQAFDISEEMVARARAREVETPLGIQYEARDLTQGLDLEPESVDLAMAVFLFNYLSIRQMRRVMREVATALRPGGRFLFSVPHPLIPFVRGVEAPFGFDRGEHTYLSGRDVEFEGRIWRRDGGSVGVRCVHKTAQDYFVALAEAGFAPVPRVQELGVTPEHLELDEAFFGPVADLPLHLLFEAVRP
jgi:SAM-dependent methyltransferase